MRRIYTISTKEFLPISYQGNYLHNNYDNLVSFLKIKLKNEKNRLAKPIQKDDKSFDFFGDFISPLKRITTFEQSKQDELLISYNDYLSKVESISNSLIRSKNKDEQDWGQILKCVFNRDDNIIISDGNDWVLVWGWSFRNKAENYIPLTTIPEKTPEAENTTISPAPPTSNYEAPTQQAPFSEDIDEEDEELINEELINEESIETNKKSKVGFFGYIKRFFRWISYRFWGLMMLIIYTLLILCICRYCCEKECPDNCSELKKTEQELIKIKERLNERCLSDTLQQ